jgi:hypothetical protein
VGKCSKSLAIVIGSIPILAAGKAIAVDQKAPSDNTQTRWETVFDSSSRYYSWSNSVGGRGAQFYAPFGAQVTGRPNDDWKVEYLLRSGTIWTRQTTASSSAEARGMTDTTASTTATYYGWNGVQPYASASVNMPTANATRSGSSGSSPTSRTDSDIVATPTLGEGWNFGPSVGANFSLNASTMVSAGYGYVNRGPFDGGPGSIPNRLDPGDVSTFNIGFGWSGERDVVQASASYSLETTTYVNRAPSYRAGDRVIAALKAGHTWTENWASRVSFNFSHFQHNDVPIPGVPDLVREAFNSNSNVYRVATDMMYSASKYSIGPTGAYLYRDRNGYDPSTLQFVSAKTSWSAGAAAQIAASDQVKISLRGERLWVQESPNPGNGISAIATNGWLASVGANFSF